MSDAPHPDQTVRVPRVPTREMWAAGADAVYGQRKRPRVHHDKLVGDVYRAMLAAAPSPEAEQAGEREAVARAIADGFMNGCEPYDEATDTVRMRYDMAADAVLASLHRPQTTAPDSGLVDRLVEALEFYGREWEWYPGDGEAPDATHPGSPPTFYEADPTGRLKDDAGQFAREALALARKGAA